MLETLTKPYQPPSIYVPSLDSAKLALERHAQNFLCLHILARRNVQYRELLEKLHPQDAKGSDIPARGANLDDSYHVKVPALELQTPNGIVFTTLFKMTVPIPGLSVVYFPSQHEFTLEYKLEKAYARLQAGTARVSEGLYPAWEYEGPENKFRPSSGCESEVFEFLELVACGIDLRLKGPQAWRKDESERYKLQPRLARVARSVARAAWGRIGAEHNETAPLEGGA